MLNKLATNPCILASYSIRINESGADGQQCAHKIFLCSSPLPESDATFGELGDISITIDTIQVRSHQGWMLWTRSALERESTEHPSILPKRVLEFRPQINMVTYAPWTTTSNWKKDWDNNSADHLLGWWERVTNLSDETRRSLQEIIGFPKPSYRSLTASDIARMAFICYSANTSGQVRLYAPSLLFSKRNDCTIRSMVSKKSRCLFSHN